MAEQDPNAQPANPERDLAERVFSRSQRLLGRIDRGEFGEARPIMIDIGRDLLALRPLVQQQLQNENLPPNAWQGFPVAQSSGDGGSFAMGFILGALAGYWFASQSG